MVEKNLVSNLSCIERRALVDMDDPVLPISVQARLFGINRQSLYYKPVSKSDDDFIIKQCIDRIYTDHPELGYRSICRWLNTYEGIHINHKAVLRHMHEMGIQAVYPRPNTSRSNPNNPIYLYLLKNLVINHPNQVWSIDITYIPIRRSWLYLVAIMDWFSRYVVSWEIDDTLDIRFVLDVSHKALEISVPEIMNSDQGSHFTSLKYTKIFLDAGSRISMDHRGRAYDNIFIERLWRTVKYENVYIRDYRSPKEARIGISEYFHYYNTIRLHSSPDYRTPESVHRSI